MIYLDHNATTPIDPAVADAMRPFIREQFGNPGSAHAKGRAAKEAVENARWKVAGLIGASKQEIVFTGSATEANNQVIKGVAAALQDKGRHIIISAVEHPAVIEPCRYLKALGWQTSVLPVDSTGLPDPNDLKRTIRPDTVLVSVMHANNETGTIMPIADLSSIARERGVLFHTDAAQSIGKLPVNVDELGVDLLTIAGHKVYAPKGVGALYVRKGVSIEPILHGGGQEGGLRSGTENVVHIVGLGEAAKVAQTRLTEDVGRTEGLRDVLQKALAERFETLLIGHPTQRLPNTLLVSFVGCKGERILHQTSEIAASVGAACHDQDVTLSHVLKAMGVKPEIGRGAIRLSLGRYTSLDEVLKAAKAFYLTVNAERSGKR
jgi:cysteine desulfurase